MRDISGRKLIALVSVSLALLLSACGSTTATTSVPTATSVTNASFTPTPGGPTAMQPTVAPSAVPASCAQGAPGSGASAQTYIKLGDLLVSKATISSLSGASNEIPQGTAAKPLPLQGSQLNSTGSSWVNPHLIGSGGLTFTVCNTSASATHTLNAVTVGIATFTPLSGSLAAWNLCQDGSYDAQAQAARIYGCGGGASVNETLQATFPASAGAGATTTAKQVGTDVTGPGQPNPFPPLPLALQPGESVLVAVGVTQPTTPGSYVFALGLRVDGRPATVFANTAPLLFAPVTQEWSGKNCEAAAMKAQIPVASQPTYYICPPAA